MPPAVDLTGITNIHERHDLTDVLGRLDPIWLLRPVSGTYRSPTPAGSGRILELRVDVDGTRPQMRLSGDVFQRVKFWFFDFTFYVESFVVEAPVVTGDAGMMTITGDVTIHGDPTRTGEAIEVHIQRVPFRAPAPAACVNWTVDGATTAVYACPKTSKYFRTATLEIDRFEGTSFPPDIDPDIDPSPDGLPDQVGVRSVFQRSGIDLRIVRDDVLTDADGPDAGSNWSEVELHDLMETRFDSFADRLQWTMYGVVVPRFGDPTYNSGYYGTMFDWGGWQSGDTFLRQGCAIAEDAILGRVSGGLYDTAAEQERLILQTFIHEVGHTWNLPHSWSRTDAPSSASTSFMNYPWGYTGGTGGESAFWSDFAWEFDDVELRWMRHADRNDVIFGGRDWIGDNLSRFLDPLTDAPALPVRVELEAPSMLAAAEPAVVRVTVVNDSDRTISVPRDLSPEAGTVHVVVERPDGRIVEHRPPTRRLLAPGDDVELKPGARHTASVQLSFPSTGPAFVDPGRYRVRAVLTPDPDVLLPSQDATIVVTPPTSTADVALLETVTRPSVARFLYFGGSARPSDLAGELTEVAERFADERPSTVAHIRAALARDAARTAKYVDDRRDRRVVVTRAADLDAADGHLAAHDRLARSVDEARGGLRRPRVAVDERLDAVRRILEDGQGGRGKAR